MSKYQVERSITDRLRAVVQKPTIVQHRPLGWSENIIPAYSVYCRNRRCGAYLGESTATPESDPERWGCGCCGTVNYFIVRSGG